MPKNLESSYHFPAFLPLSYYYDQMSASMLSYREYLLKVSMARDIENTIESNADKQVAANAFFTELLKSSIVDEQIASTKALYNNMQTINGTLLMGFSDVSNSLDSGFTELSGQLQDVSDRVQNVSNNVKTGFSEVSGRLQDVSDRVQDVSNNVKTGFSELSRQVGQVGVGIAVIQGQLQTGFKEVTGQMQAGFSAVSRQIGYMHSDMCMGFASLNSAVQASSKAICEKLDAINDILSNRFLYQARELYNRASLNYDKKFFEEVLEDLLKAIEYNKTDYISWFLLGKTYLFGLGEFSDVVDLDKSIEALKTAAKYIKPDAKTHGEAKVMAAEIWYYLGLARQARANDALHRKNTAEWESYLKEARDSFGQSYDYSEEELESRYLLAQCKALLHDVQGALQVLEPIMLKAPKYCMKIGLDTNFDGIRGELREFFARLKKTVFPEAKACFGEIQRFKAQFQFPYSPELKQLIYSHLPDSFTEDLPLFDILEGGIFFRKILKHLKHLQEKYFSSIGVNGTVLKKYRGPGGNVILPYGITKIGDKAFYDCKSLTSITIPESVTSIGDKAFDGCYSLTSIAIPGSVTSIGDYAFYDCKSLTSITIPGSVTSIGDYAFCGCCSLTGITIPESVTSIGDKAFDGCYSLTGIAIPGSVTSIGDYAFFGCRSLTSITIPGSVTRIGDYAFCGCCSLTGITIPESVTSIGEGAFCGCDSLTSITIPKSVTSIRKGAFACCENLTNITIPGSVTRIGEDAFQHCKNLTSITIPGSVTSIGKGAFAYCKNLTSITIPESVTSIGDKAFDGCDSLTSITIPQSVTSIGDDTFRDCESLTSITIPESVTSIGDYAFGGCDSLTSITIPKSVTSIKDNTFDKCYRLTRVLISRRTKVENECYKFIYY